MHCKQLQLPLHQQQQKRKSVGQENATHAANQCVVTMQLNVNQKSDNLSNNVCCARLKILMSNNCDTLVSAARFTLLDQMVYFVDLG